MRSESHSDAAAASASPPGSGRWPQGTSGEGAIEGSPAPTPATAPPRPSPLPEGEGVRSPASAGGPLRLLIVCPHLDNSARLLADMLRYLDPSFDVTLFVLENSIRFDREFPENARRVVLDHGMRKGSIAGTFCKLWREARRHDLVVCFAELSPTYVTSAACLLARRPCIGWVHAHLSRIFALGQRPGRVHRPFIRLFYRRLDACVGVSQGVSDDLAHTYGLKRSVAIVNGIDLARVRRLADEPLPEHLRPLFDDGTPVVVNVAALHYQKNPQLLIEAHARLIGQGVNHRLLMVGDGPLRGEIERLLRERDLTRSVTLAGYVNNPYPLIQRAACLALASRWEGYALVLAEALAVGTIPVSTDVRSGPREILGDNEFGLLVPEGDAAALGEALRALLTDPAARSTFQSRAALGAERCSILPRVRQMEALFRQVVA